MAKKSIPLKNNTKFERKAVSKKSPRPLTASKEEQRIILKKKKVLGHSIAKIAKDHGLTKSAVASLTSAERRGRIDEGNGVALLRNQFLRVAIAANEQVETKIEDLAPKDAAVVAGIATSNFIELQKKAGSDPVKVQPHELASIAAALATVKAKNSVKQLS